MLSRDVGSGGSAASRVTTSAWRVFLCTTGALCYHCLSASSHTHGYESVPGCSFRFATSRRPSRWCIRRLSLTSSRPVSTSCCSLRGRSVRRRDAFQVVPVFLQKRCAYPELCRQHDGPGTLLLTPRLDAQTTFAKLFARLDASTSVDIFSSVPAQVGVSGHVQESMADVRAICSCCPSPMAGGRTAYGRYAFHALGLALPRGHQVVAEGHQSAGYEQTGAAPAAAAAGAQIGFQGRARQKQRGLLGLAAQARCRPRSAGGRQGAGGWQGPGWQCH